MNDVCEMGRRAPFIADEFVDASEGKTFDIFDPDTGETFDSAVLALSRMQQLRLMPQPVPLGDERERAGIVGGNENYWNSSRLHRRRQAMLIQFRYNGTI
jgi:hypothetical protein